VDAAIVVIEPEPAKVQMLKPYLKRLADLKIPHLMFVNKIDKANGSLREILSTLQEASDLPLLLRQIPIWENEVVTGFVDLALERAFAYREQAHSETIDIADREREKEARFAMLEKLADYDEHLMEELLSDVEPPREEVFGDLKREFAECLVVPVLIGSAEGDHGIRRLLKALRHETPDVATTTARLKLDPKKTDTVAQVIKTYHPPNTGKLSLVRVWSGQVHEGMSLNGVRVAGVVKLLGAQSTKVPSAGAGEVVALARLEGIATGTVLSSGTPPELPHPPLPAPVYGLAIAAEKRSDDVKLAGALARLIEEDPTLSVEHNAELQEIILWGQGDIHLQIALDRLKERYNLTIASRRATVPYKETIKLPGSIHSRFKRQSGGHGQFADIQIEIKPLPRGSGHVFKDAVVGGAIPRNYIPAVEEGVMEYLKRGPLGFPVVDVAVTLVTGQFHDVDSSDQAFKTVGRQAMAEQMPKCNPVLLEPICHVEISVPNAFTSRVQRIVSGRRGQILGFDAKPGWGGWDAVAANMPQSELHDLIVELRSVTLGVGTYVTRFDHLQELTGKLAERALNARSGGEAAAQ
jgi:elongation factor G